MKELDYVPLLKEQRDSVQAETPSGKCSLLSCLALQVGGVQWEMLQLFQSKALPTEYNRKQLVTTSKYRNFSCLCSEQMEI